MNATTLTKQKIISRRIIGTATLYIFLFGGSILGYSYFLKNTEYYSQSIQKIDPIFIYHIFHYALLICSICFFISALCILSINIVNFFNFENSSLGKKIEKTVYYSIILSVISIFTLPILGHYYSKHKFSQSGYTQCSSSIVKNRHERAWVLEPENCQDGKLRWILTQRDRKKSEVLQEARVYLNDKNQ